MKPSSPVTYLPPEQLHIFLHVSGATVAVSTVTKVKTEFLTLISNTGRPGSYRLSPVELHALRKARLRFRPSLHLLHDPLDVIPGDPVEKHGSRSWTQRATACLCLAAHNFHILYCSAAPRSLSASKWALRLWTRHTKKKKTNKHNPRDSDHLPRQSAKATGRKERRRKLQHGWDKEEW